MTETTEKAILAGGCFRGMQNLLRKRRRHLDRVGYTGGDVPNATYRHHATHAEAIEIVSPPSGSLRTRVLARTPTQLTLLRLGDLGRLTSHDSNVRAVMKLRLTAANVFPRAGNSHRPATRLPGRAGS